MELINKRPRQLLQKSAFFEGLLKMRQGQIAEVIAHQVAKQNTGLASFLKDLQKMLIFAAIALAVYLSIPLFYSKHCQKQAEQKMTKPPFPVKPPSK